MSRKTHKGAEDVTRRTILRLGAGAAIGAPLAGLEQKQRATSPTRRKHLFFTPAEWSLVDELSEMIIPADDHSPGARAAKVADYIDQRLAEAFDEAPRERWRTGLKLVDELSVQMHGRAFLKATPDERLAVLTRMAQNERKAEKPEERFFVELKSGTARGYYTSKIGIHTEMEYKGNTYLREFAGEDAK